MVRAGNPYTHHFLFSFSYNLEELAMCHYFETHKHLVDR